MYRIRGPLMATLIYSGVVFGLYMARARYWKLTADEVSEFRYNEDKLLNWDIKCVREPEESAIFVGVFHVQKWNTF